MIGRAAANTAALAVVALAVATLLGIPLGIFTGSRRGAAAAVVRGASLVFLSVPPLLTSLLPGLHRRDDAAVSGRAA